MRNGPARTAQQTPKQGVSGIFAATGKADFELFHYDPPPLSTSCQIAKKNQLVGNSDQLIFSPADVLLVNFSALFVWGASFAVEVGVYYVAPFSGVF